MWATEALYRAFILRYFLFVAAKPYNIVGLEKQASLRKWAPGTGS